MVVKGKPLTLKEHIEKLKNELKDMTPKEKLDHLWTYYKWVAGVVLGVIFVIAATIASIKSLNTPLRLSGVLINVDVSPDGYVHLQDGYFKRIGAEEGKELVNLRNMQFENPYTTVDQTYTFDVQESVVALIGARELDYLLFDELALPFFLDPETILDLRELFSQEELDAMGSAVIKLQIPETGELIPMAIDIGDTAFYRDYMETDKTIFLAYAINSPRREACLDFWQFIKGGETAGLETKLAGTVIDAALSEQNLKTLDTDFFEAQGYVVGDHRVELTRQSFLPPESAAEEDATDMVKDHVRQTLETGALDYLVASKAALEELDSLLDLGQLLTEQELEALAGALLYRDGRPVAVELSKLGFSENEAWLAFNENTNRMEACKALWAYMQP